MKTLIILKKTSGILVLTIAFVGSVWFQMRNIENAIEGELARELGKLKLVLTSVLNEAPARIEGAAVRQVLTASDLRGIEIFTRDGRRIWSTGEPLELTAYRLDRETALTHRSVEHARFEIFWPASNLAATYGLAARLDISWQESLKRDLQRSAVIGSAAIAVTVLIVSLARFSSSRLPFPSSMRISAAARSAPGAGAQGKRSQNK